MKLRELFESSDKHVTFVFGRMNPPTIGHGKLLDTAANLGGDYMIFTSQSQDPKKNPLDYATKIKFLKALFPEHANHIIYDSTLNTVVKVASFLYDRGYKTVTFVAGSDRLEDMKKLLDAYNGVEGKAHGFYKFDSIDYISSGEREDGVEGISGISATNARAAAANDDFESFKSATGAGKYSRALYDAVRKGMGIKMRFQEFTTEQESSHEILKKKLQDIESRNTSPEKEKEEYQKHIERMKVSKKEYLKKNPQSIYK